MHKLVEYICDELDELERKADKDGKLSMAEIQYMDTLAHAKKNLLKGEILMEEEDYSGMDNPDHSYGSMSMARGRGRNAKRDAMGRYSSERGRGNRGGQSNRSYNSYNVMSYNDEMRNMIDSIYDIMDDLPEATKHEAHKFVKKLEQTM